MEIDTAKLRAIIPDLESWTGGERRDLDAKIAEACGWDYVRDQFDVKVWFAPGGACSSQPPHYLGTDPSIATEDMQRLVRESGFEWYRLRNSGIYFCDPSHGAKSLPVAWARAVIAKEDGK